MLKFDDCSCFQTRSDSSAYYNVFLVPLVEESFKAYETTTYPLAFPTGRSINKSLQRGLCHVEVRRLLMFSDQVRLFGLLQCFIGAIGGRKFQSIWNYYIPSCIPHWQIHKQISTERALPHRSSVYNHGFLHFVLLNWNWAHSWGNFKEG